MQALGFKQHLTGAAHKQGNTQDLIFTELTSEIQVTNSTIHGYFLDHTLVPKDTNLNKEKYGKKVKTIQDITEMTKEYLEANFTLPLFEETTLLSQVCNLFDKELQEMLDRVASSKTIKVTNKPRKPWFNKCIRDQRIVVRNRERTWRHCWFEHQWKAYKTERNIYNILLMYH